MPKLNINKSEKEMTEASDCFFSKNLIDLAYEKDKESKRFTSTLIWPNIFLKITKKLEKLTEYLFNRAIKNRIDFKKNHGQAFAPNDLLLYRGNYWEQIGSDNFRKMFEQTDSTSFSLSTQLLSKIFKLVNQGKLKIICPSKEKAITLIKPTSTYLFFDSYYFFNGGHVSLVEQTIDNLQFANSNAILVFLLDKRMTLFPTLTKAIVNKCKNIIMIDSTDFPVKLPSGTKSNPKNEQLHINNEVNLDASILSHNSIFNPCICWKKYPYKTNLLTKKAWGQLFDPEYSFTTTYQLIQQKNNQILQKPYVVIHTRNSTLMSESIRNSIPLAERGELLESLIDMGLNVIVLGVMEPAFKYKNSNIIYVDELGPVSDDLQLHILNGAIGLIGSPSGITHLAYCTDTPLLLIDMPFPFCNTFPNSHMKALMKRLRCNGQWISLSKYYEYSQSVHLEHHHNKKIFSFLFGEEAEFEYNSNRAILHAFKELLSEAYTTSDLKNINVNQKANSIDTSTAKIDKEKINSALQIFQDKSYRFPYITSEHLSSANWHY